MWPVMVYELQVHYVRSSSSLFTPSSLRVAITTLSLIWRLYSFGGHGIHQSTHKLLQQAGVGQDMQVLAVSEEVEDDNNRDGEDDERMSRKNDGAKEEFQDQAAGREPPTKKP